MLLEDYASVLESADLIPGIEMSIGKGGLIAGRYRLGDLDIITIETSGEPIRVSLEIPLGDVEGYWYPNASERALPPDWSGKDKTSIISSAPIGCLYDRLGRNILAFAFDQQIQESQLRFGVSEEHKSFVVYYEHVPDGPTKVRLAIARPGMAYAGAIGLLRDWLRDDVGTALPVPYAGSVPVYCTWYAYSQDVSAEKVEREAAMAYDLGCRAIIIDDGWQRLGHGRWYAGCGDWVPDTEKFPDMRAHVARLREIGMSVMLWVAPLLLGAKSDAAERLGAYAPYYGEGLRGRVLDPRYKQVRDHFVDTCIRVVRDYGLDGLKVDFLDSAVVYQGTETGGDIPDVGRALHAILIQLRDGLRAANLSDVLIEFRQSYIGPATAPYGNLLRAGDCPVDANLNRRSIVNTRMIAAGQLVHSDPAVWDHRAGAEPAVRQLLNAYFGVPQVSMELSTLSDVQRDAVRATLSQWMEDREAVLFGSLKTTIPSEGYPVLQARHGEKLVVGIYHPRVAEIDLDGAKEVTLLNATSQDRVVVRWIGKSAGIVGTIYAPTGAVVGQIDTLANGLAEIVVPVSGTAKIRVGA